MADRTITGVALLVTLGTATVGAQPWERGLLYAPLTADSIAPPVLREFRAAWLTTVDNIDWPSRPGLPVAVQQAELRALLDSAQRVHLNAIIFQVRPSADALYRSSIEPWSYFLTGAMGRAPVPAWDPLEFAIEEAHKRGMELHAWFNPYRSRHPADKGPAAASHVSRAHPSWNRKYGAFGWMDPGEPAVRARTRNVILDVVRRYDVDGVHMDDYFYPYPERNRRGEIPFPDSRSFTRYVRGGGKLARDDWRRDNVDRLIRELYDSVKAAKPWVRVGISPFGIWRPGYPASVSGFDAYDKLYADSRRWLHEGWLDYLTPQLYWQLEAPRQPYADLLAWWRTENTRNRHLWPGNYTGRASAAGRVTWSAGEILDQVHETRRQLGEVSGNVHFPLNAFLHTRDQLNDRLAAGPYAEPALVPSAPWLAVDSVIAPAVKAQVKPEGVELRIEPHAPLPRATGTPATRSGSRTRPATPRPRANDVRWWVVRARYADGWRVQVIDVTRTIARLGVDPGGELPNGITVSAIDRTGRESAPVTVTP